MRESLCPCTMNVGQRTCYMASMFLNLSVITYYRIEPAYSLTMSLMLLKGDIKSKELGLLLAAMCVAGPEPIERPNMMMESWGTYQEEPS